MADLNRPGGDDPLFITAAHEDTADRLRQTGQWRRLHPLSPVIDSAVFIVVIVGIMIVNMRDALLAPLLYDAASSKPGFWESIYGVVKAGEWGNLIIFTGLTVPFLLLLLLYWLTWRFREYRVSTENVQLRQGIIFKTQKLAPLNKIQGIDLVRPLLARIVGLTQIKIITASGQLELRYLAHDQAKTVRAELLRLLDKGDADSSAQIPCNRLDRIVHGVFDPDLDRGAIEKDSLVRIPVSRLLLASLLSGPAIIIIGCVAMVVASIYFEPLRWLLPSILPALFAAAALFFKHINSGFGFTISEHDAQVRISSGLTSTKSETLPLHKIHTVMVSQSIFWRMFGWYRVQVLTAGAVKPPSGQATTQSMFMGYDALPVGSQAELEKVLQLLLADRFNPEVLAAGKKYRRLQYGAQRRAVPLTVLSARNHSAQMFGHNPATSVFVCRCGLIVNYTAYILPSRVQAIQYRVGFMHRLLNLAEIKIVRPGAAALQSGASPES